MIQRYRCDGQGDCDPGGGFVLYADHAAALAEARDRGYGEAMDDGWGEPGHIKAAVAEATVTEFTRMMALLPAHVEAARADALQQAREALELLALSLVDTRFDPDDERCCVQAVRLTTALAAIDNLKGEQA